MVLAVCLYRQRTMNDVVSSMSHVLNFQDMSWCNLDLAVEENWDIKGIMSGRVNEFGHGGGGG